MHRIQQLLPEARFIQLIRVGRDGGQHTVEDGARWWVERMMHGRQEAKSLTHDVEVRYEDSVWEPEPTLRRICSFIKLPWDPAMRSHHTAAARQLVDEGSLPTLRAWPDRVKVSSPSDTTRVGRWRPGLTAEKRQRVDGIAGELLHELGFA